LITENKNRQEFARGGRKPVMQHDQASAVLDSEIPTDVIRRQCEANAADSSQNLDEMTAFQDVQIRRLEDLGSWADSFLENPEQVRLLQEVHRSNPRFAHRLAQAAVAMPEVGTDFVGFRLVKEIGKGAFARVFLAVQGELADRLVVLKVSPSYDDESGTLAQLQHTNVVPLYSVHRAEPLQAFCFRADDLGPHPQGHQGAKLAAGIGQEFGEHPDRSQQHGPDRP
jgi:hypothetical protein